MKILIKYIMIALVATATGISCTKKFDEINSNPDKSTTSNDAWLATSMLTSITSADITSPDLSASKIYKV